MTSYRILTDRLSSWAWAAGTRLLALVSVRVESLAYLILDLAVAALAFLPVSSSLIHAKT